MKNIRYILLGVFISFILFFITGIVFSIINTNNKVHVQKYDGFNSVYETYNTKIDKVKNDNCRLSLKYMLERIKDNYFDHDVSIKEYYESYYKDDLTFIDYYDLVISSCEIKSDVTNIYNEAMSSMIYPEYIKNKYNRGYEIYFKDYLYNDKQIDSIGTYSTIISELTTLNLLMEEYHE